MAGTSTSLHYSIYSAGTLQPCQGQVISESAVKLFLNNERLVTFICSPVELDYLAAGYLYYLGWINSKNDMDAIIIDPGANTISVQTSNRFKTQAKDIDMAESQKPSNTGKLALVPEVTKIPAGAPLEIMEAFYAEQNRISQSSGLHSSALATLSGIEMICEDIGRHNTLDKLAGKKLLDRPDYNPLFMITTGRISSDMVDKAYRIGASILISRTTPTHAAVASANTLGLTVIGYTRLTSYNIYTHNERVIL